MQSQSTTEIERLDILVVDDEPQVVDVLLRFLRRRGYRAIGASDAATASALVRADPAIGVVLSDVRMPGVDGLQLAQDLLHDRSEDAALEVVLLTGGATTDVALGALRAGTFDLLQKPPRLAEVAKVVDRAVARGAARRSAARAQAQVHAAMRAALAESTRLTDTLAQSAARLDDARSALRDNQAMRRDLLAVISHEMRSPLIPILGFAEIFAAGGATDPQAQRDYGRLIHDGARRLQRIIDAALDIVALDHGPGFDPGPPERVARLMRRVAEAATAAECGVALAMEGPADLLIAGDQRRLAAAIGHLLDNAIKVSPGGGVVDLTWGRSSPGRLEIVVRDRGPGVPTAILAQLGTPFLQADMSLARAWQGAGLGLALAQRVATAHGGALTLRPRDGGGTDATLDLPSPA